MHDPWRLEPSALGVAFVLVPKAAELTGYTVGAIDQKIKRGQWAQGREYVIAPDGRRLISLRGFERWVLQGRSA